MISEYISSLKEYAVYGIIVMVLFMVIFIVWVIRVMMMNKEDLEEAANTPFEEHELNNREGN